MNTLDKIIKQETLLYIQNLLIQCNEKQKDLFCKIFQCNESLEGLKKEKWNDAVGILERTIFKKG